MLRWDLFIKLLLSYNSRYKIRSCTVYEVAGKCVVSHKFSSR
uniref:Uncharacterized protein n=1 Tax=Arundo donax TaxID=35708 RepID=A0A0A9H3S0_ARUDO